MRIWLIADTHFSHKNITKFQERPEDFAELIYKNLVDVLRPDDILIHLGDFCLGRDENNHLSFKFVPGRKWLVRGNHDGKSDHWYLTHGWDFVCKSFTIKKYSKKIMFSHTPQEDYGYDINIHGHLHSDRTRYPDLPRNKKQFLLSIEELNYKPLNLEYFREY